VKPLVTALIATRKRRRSLSLFSGSSPPCPNSVWPVTATRLCFTELSRQNMRRQGDQSFVR
jgi:hypothetical protein